jgi:hypothetical protein
MVLSLVCGLYRAAPGSPPGVCVKHAALLRASGVAREKLNRGNTSFFNPNAPLNRSLQP